MKSRISKAANELRISKALKIKNEFLSSVEDIHVKLQPGNSKTGNACWTVSLLPVIDCKNCAECRWMCYDINNVLFQQSVVTDRARNSAIHSADLKRFWNEVALGIDANYVTELRINVGGDVSFDDFIFIKEIAETRPRTDFLFFTKSYDDINSFLDKNDFPPNVHAIISRWPGTECDNRHGLPESHVLFEDGSTTAPEYGAYYCNGNCSECHFKQEGCWSLKNGEHVIFRAH